MNDKSKKWKDFLLKSSIPLEYEVKKLMDEYGCVSNYEFTYLRENENKVEHEFSYDIDASYIKGGHFFNLMIECKYRDVTTNWIFTPENYGGKDEVESYSFLNPNDHFTQKHKFRRLDYEPLAPLCGKGIEINSNGQNPKSITQAINQLSYAMAEKVVSGMEHQIEKLLNTSEIIFYNIPIIVTTANLYRLKDNVTIQDVKDSNELSDVAIQEECLVLKGSVGKHLEDYNLQEFNVFISEYGRQELNEKLVSFNEDIGFVSSVIAKEYCPGAILVVQLTESGKGFSKVFEFLDEIVEPSEKTINRQIERQKKIDEIISKIERIKK